MTASPMPLVAFANSHGLTLPLPVIIGAVVVIFIIGGVMFARRNR